MNTVEQRILIHIAPTIIWEYLSNLENNPAWQTDCEEISFLTSAREGSGARWRQKATSGREYVIEITAWYERVGYEYRIVDGTPYSQNQGRIRLQETVEGTVVQWTFSYEVEGIFSGLRNAISTQRSIENNIVDSLWNLWRRISETQKGQAQYEAKALMRDAPDVEARALYRSKHPSVVTQLTEKSGDEPGLEIDEPPVSDEDTRPRPAVASGDAADAEKPQPSTMSTEVMPAVETPDTPASEIPSSTTLPQIDDDTQTEEDTAKVSVFDVFGVPKPSDAQPAVAASPEETEEAASAIEPTTDASSVSHGGRIGARVMIRREQTNVRRPK